MSVMSVKSVMSAGAFGIWRGILVNFRLGAWVDFTSVGAIPSDSLNSRDRHIAWEISFVDRGCHINSRK